MTPKEIEGWIEDWCNLFPKDVEFGGYKIRSDSKYCIKKMLTFCKEHKDYTKDNIFAATRMYLHEQLAKNWAYTKQATYFISKLGQPSLLEAYCERVVAGKKSVIPDNCEYHWINDFI
jgi:hypothetical protein